MTSKLINQWNETCAPNANLIAAVNNMTHGRNGLNTTEAVRHALQFTAYMATNHEKVYRKIAEEMGQ